MHFIVEIFSSLDGKKLGVQSILRNLLLHFPIMYFVKYIYDILGFCQSLEIPLLKSFIMHICIQLQKLLEETVGFIMYMNLINLLALEYTLCTNPLPRRYL